MTSKCIMKINDYITAADVNKLTPDQWDQFRSYLRGYGYQVADLLGKQDQDHTYNINHCVILDKEGDLFWCDRHTAIDKDGKQVTYEQIIEMIQPKCIMKINDYVRKCDVYRLTGTQWEQFRKYLQSHGYRVDDDYGNYSPSYSDKWCIILNDDGDLSWVKEPNNQTQRITCEQIIGVVGESQPSEPPHVRARNQHINEIKQLIALHEELITRLTNTDTIGLKTSIDHHQQQIDYLRKSLEEAKHRCSGRTTNIALKTIAQAMQCPRTVIPIIDHHGTRESHRHLAGMIESMLAKLQLTGFVIDRSKLTLHYQDL